MIQIAQDRTLYECFDAEGRKLHRGDTVISSRGKQSTFEMLTRAPRPGKSALVLVDGREFYADVFNIEVKPKS